MQQPSAVTLTELSRNKCDGLAPGLMTALHGKLITATIFVYS